MATVKHHKVVAALPAELEPDALYLVRSGAGFDLYATNHSGLIAAYPLNVGPPGQGFFRTEPITATATGQTVFTVPGGYTPGATFVSLNGATLPPADYTALNGTTVVLATGQGIVAGSVLLVYVLSAFEVADALPLEGTAADASKLGGTLAVEFYQRSNIVGAVSQSVGVPTGAIIERITSVNGTATKYADGTMVCHISGLSATYVSSGRIEGTWTFPAQFVADDYSIGITLLGGLDFAKCVGLPNGISRNVSSVSCGFRSPSGTFATGDVANLSVTAHGRWFQ